MAIKPELTKDWRVAMGAHSLKFCAESMGWAQSMIGKEGCSCFTFSGDSDERKFFGWRVECPIHGHEELEKSSAGFHAKLVCEVWHERRNTAIRRVSQESLKRCLLESTKVVLAKRDRRYRNNEKQTVIWRRDSDGNGASE